MIIINHKREIIANTAILGTWYLDGKDVCKVLENPYRQRNKDSAIPTGTYDCVRDDTGKFRFYKILNVPNRSNIEIHQGNREKDTEGCLLVGDSWGFLQGELAVLNSNKTITKLKKILPEKFTLVISDKS